MPQVQLIDPWGLHFGIDTRNPDTLRAWFDEMLPIMNAHYGDRRVPAAQIMVRPLYSSGVFDSADWHADARVTGASYPFKAKTGRDAMAELELLRELLQVKLDADRAGGL